MLAGAPVALDLAATSTTRTSGQRRAEDVAMSLPHGAGRAGDDRDRRGPGRQRPLARRVEQALGGQAGLELLEPEREVAEPGRLERLDVQLERALRLEQVDPAVGDDAQPGLGLERRAERGRRGTRRTGAGCARP